MVYGSCTKCYDKLIETAVENILLTDAKIKSHILVQFVWDNKFQI